MWDQLGGLSGVRCRARGALPAHPGRKGATDPPTHLSVALLNLYLDLKIAFILTWEDNVQRPQHLATCRTVLVPPKDRRWERAENPPQGWREPGWGELVLAAEHPSS